MGINGIGVGYPAWREAGKMQRNQVGTGFADTMAGAEENNFDASSIQGVTGQISAQEAYQASVIGNGLTTWYQGKNLEEWAATDPKYTDKETGFSWYVRDGKHPYMTGKDVAKFKKMCEETGESWLKKFAEMTGIIQHLDDNTTAFVGTNGTVMKSRDGKELEIDTSSMTYDMIMNMFKNLHKEGI